MSRLTRKEMKRDEVIETMGSVVEYTRRHVRGLVWGAVAVIVLIAIAAGVFVWRGAQGSKADQLLADAMAAGSEAEAPDAEQLSEVVERFPGSRAAAAARLMLARRAAADGDAETARQMWQRVARDRVGTALGLQAQVNLYELDRQQGRHAELIAELRAALDRDRPELPRDQLLYQLALTLEGSGATDEARETYQRLLDEHPESSLRATAQSRVDRLPGGTALG